MTAGTRFAADMRRWSETARRNADLIAKAAILDVVDEAQRPVAKGGRMPVDTGVLRNSIKIEGSGAAGTDAVLAYIQGAQMGGTISVRWGAEYAARVNYVGKDGIPYHFLDNAVMRWPDFVQAQASLAP